MPNYEFDVAFSFAGDQRAYAKRVAELLKESGLAIFFDEFQEVAMWGENLLEHLDAVYGKKARRCVLFISDEYVAKGYPTHERRSALARALNEHGYILPVRFTDVDVPGLQNTVTYLDGRKKSPEQLADAILQKLGKDKSEPAMKQPTHRLPKRQITFNPYEEENKFISEICGELKRRCNTEDSGLDLSMPEREGRKCLRFLADGKIIYSLDVIRGGVSSDTGLSFAYSYGEMRVSSGFNAWGNFEIDPERNVVALKLNDMSLFGHFNSRERFYTADQFADAIWNVVCDQMEKQNG